MISQFFHSFLPFFKIKLFLFHNATTICFSCALLDKGMKTFAHYEVPNKQGAIHKLRKAERGGRGVKKSLRFLTRGRGGTWGMPYVRLHFFFQAATLPTLYKFPDTFHFWGKNWQTLDHILKNHLLLAMTHLNWNLKSLHKKISQCDNSNVVAQGGGIETLRN